MRANRFALGLSVVLTGMAAACGTIVDGSSQTVDVVVKGSPSAFCDFTTDVTRNAGTFPNKLTLERSRKPLTADCRGEQNLYKKFTIEPIFQEKQTIAGNVPFGVAPGVGYDAASGGMWAYPDPIIVDFRVVETDPPNKGPEWPAATVDDDTTRIGTATIAAPRPVRMQPIMDEQLDPALGSRASMAPQPVVTKSVTTTTTTAPASQSTARAQMRPVISPEDDPAVFKAKQEAKAKAAAEAKRKKEQAAARKRAEEEAKRKAEEEAKARAEAEAAAAAAAASETPPAATTPAEPMPAPVEDPAPASEPAAQPSAEPAAPTPTPTPADEPAKAEGEAGTPAQGDATKSDMDKYIQGQ